MDEPENNSYNPDVTEELNTIIRNQQATIERLENIQSELELERTELQHQTAILYEELDGLSLIVNYQYTTLAVVLIFSVVVGLWKVLNKWFFGGV